MHCKSPSHMDDITSLGWERCLPPEGTSLAAAQGAAFTSLYGHHVIPRGLTE